MLRQVYGDDSISLTQCYKWHRNFKSGRTSVEDGERSEKPFKRSGKPSITLENVQLIWKFVHGYRPMKSNDTAGSVVVS